MAQMLCDPLPLSHSHTRARDTHKPTSLNEKNYLFKLFWNIQIVMQHLKPNQKQKQKTNDKIIIIICFIEIYEI